MAIESGQDAAMIGHGQYQSHEQRDHKPPLGQLQHELDEQQQQQQHPKHQPRCRRRDNREFWRLALSLQQASGLSMSAFCRREGLKIKSLSRWKCAFDATVSARSLATSSPGEFKFVPVTLKPSDITACGGLTANGDGLARVVGRHAGSGVGASGTAGVLAEAGADAGTAAGSTDGAKVRVNSSQAVLQITLANGRLLRINVAAEVGAILPVLEALEVLP